MLWTYVTPLSFVLIVSLGKEASDDFGRWMRDRGINNKKYEKMGVNGTISKISCSSISVGDIVKVH